MPNLQNAEEIYATPIEELHTVEDDGEISHTSFARCQSKLEYTDMNKEVEALYKTCRATEP